MDLLHFKRMVSLLNEISKREISEQHILGHVFFTVPQPTLLSIVELQFFFYLGQELFFRLKLGTIVPTSVGHPSLGTYFSKNEQDRCNLPFYILTHRALIFIIISGLAGNRYII